MVDLVSVLATAIEEATSEETWLGGAHKRQDGEVFLGVNGEINLTKLAARLQEVRVEHFSLQGVASGPGGA